MSHTKGPWIVGDADQLAKPFLIYSNRDGFKTYICVGQNVHFDESQNVPNARLIAAAPELLDACRVALSNLQRNLASEVSIGEPFMGDDEHEAMLVLTTAIAKATGGP